MLLCFLQLLLVFTTMSVSSLPIYTVSEWAAPATLKNFINLNSKSNTTKFYCMIVANQVSYYIAIAYKCEHTNTHANVHTYRVIAMQQPQIIPYWNWAQKGEISFDILHNKAVSHTLLYNRKATIVPTLITNQCVHYWFHWPREQHSLNHIFNDFLLLNKNNLFSKQLYNY